MKHSLLFAALVLLAGCVRNELPVKQSNSRSRVDHLIIKEVFYVGHYWVRDLSAWGWKNTNQMYTDDQYIVIYNPTDEVKYLDGLALCTNAIDPTQAVTFAPKDDFVNRYYGASGISYFPGSGTEHPVQPRQSIVVAKYAIDHQAQYEKELEGEDLSLYKGLDAFLDLSKADFEWTNIQYDPGHKNNPNVPDLHAILEEKENGGKVTPAFDFGGLSEHAGLALIRLPWTPDDFKAHYPDTKERRGYRHYITVTSSAFGDLYAIEVPFSHVIDCITICPRSRFQMRPCKLDKGHNAISDASISSMKQSEYPKYSGLALTRTWDGRKFVADNNTTADFEVKISALARKDAKGNPIK